MKSGFPKNTQAISVSGRNSRKGIDFAN